MSIDELREGRKGATVIFMAFTRLKEKYANSIFCCFEGDDSKYYFKRIEDATGYQPQNIVTLNCEGKSEVLRFYSLISQKPEYNEVKLAYFIDKDFDPPVDKNVFPLIYETPVYSVENFYTTFDAFIRIVKCEFNYIETDTEFDFLVQVFTDRQKEFHEKTTYLNAWIACQRDKSAQGLVVRTNMSSFPLSKIITKIDLDTIEANYNKALLESYFPTAFILTEEEIQQKIKYFSNLNHQEIFRGKFEIDFLYSFLEAVKIELNEPKARLKKKPGVQLNQSKKNMISEFSHYASTKNCLVKYLKSYSVA